MTGLRERLGQVSARIVPGAGGFWAWWSQALLSWLPSRWRALLGVSDARLLLEPADAQLMVSLLQGGQRQSLQVLPSGSVPNEVDAALPPRVAGLPRYGLLPVSAVLRKPLRMPAAAETRLREVLGFEIDRQTPFSAAQVYYDVRLLQRRDDGQLDTELVVAPRQLVDALLGPVEVWQQQLDGVDAVGAEGQPLGVNLLPLPMRRQRIDPMRRLNRLLLIAGLVMLVLAAWQLLENRRAAAAQLSTQVEASAVRARAVAAQRQQLQDLVDGQQFFTAQRAQQPSATEIINELSQRLGDDTSLEKLSIEGGRMQLIGMSGSASSLVSKLEGSKLWRTPSLTGVLQAGQGAGRERFTLTAELRGPNQEAADGIAPRAP